ncbi:MAG TPA: hypothetical protein VMW48_04015 [Vicinamibacterales bacterium]|nr:hypothetical protein [Vicinamibacterales bacterium]
MRDGVASPLPALAAFLCGWLIQFAGVVTDNLQNLVDHPSDREHPELVLARAVGSHDPFDASPHAACQLRAGADWRRLSRDERKH